MSLEKFINNPEFSWIFEVDQIEGDDPSFYENSLEQELEIDLHQSLNRLIAIVFGPVLPFLIGSSIINSNDSALSLESSESFKKFSDKNEMALIKENPDFWTPLTIVLLFAMISMYSGIYVTSWIILIWIFGSGLIFILARVLGGEFSYALVLGTIGYCLIPIIFCSFMAYIFNFASSFLGHVCKLVGVLWATLGSSNFLASMEYKDKQILLAYPIFLLYIYFLHLYSGV